MAAAIRGRILDIQRFSVQDGPGIRTTVFLQGCPLTCPWCHNPESQEARAQPAYYREKCLLCGKCIAACPYQALAMNAAGTAIERNRERCRRCGRCAEACPAGAMASIGREITIAELLPLLERDRPFYRRSDGGVTISGGEPLAQPDFTLALARACQDAGLHVALDTSGYGAPGVLGRLLPYLDLVLFDLKLSETREHQALLGASQEPVLASGRLLAASRVPVWLRVPVIPGYTDGATNQRGLARLVKELGLAPRAERIELLPYHRLGEGKYRALGREYALQGTEPPEPATMAAIQALWREEGLDAHIAR
ncbi:glycyl-radical enzyme activating protein [Moorella naiadis]|uniref:glycyl-radical enzyme activating protein n=1 Tax=Moorella naiadis (nom. illeg.) TaxID=3093670 RepID=UPI003D9C975F